MIRLQSIFLLWVVFLSLLILYGCDKNQEILEQEIELTSIYNEEFKKNSFNNDLRIDIEHSGEIKELKGFSLFKVTIFVEDVKRADQYIISNGKYLITASEVGGEKDLTSKYIVENIIKKRDKIDVDISKAIYLKGDVYSENRAVLIMNFDSIDNYNFNHKEGRLFQGAENNSMALYMLMNPSDENKNSEILSRIFLSAQEMDINLYENIFNLNPVDYAAISEEEIITIFASFFDDSRRDQFRSLVKSPYMADKVKKQKKYVAETLGITDTPTPIYNNYSLEGTQEILAAFLFLNN